MLKKNFFLSVFVLLALFKSAYIAIFTQYFNLESNNIAIITRIIIIVFGIILFFSQGKKLINKNYFYIMMLFWITYTIILFQFQLDPKIDLTKDNIYFFGLASFIIIFASVLYACYENLNNLSKSIFYILIIFSVSVLFIRSDVIQNFDVTHSRLELNSLNSILVGYFAGVLVLISLWRMFYTKDKKFILFSGFMIGLWLLLAANSKGPILGVLLSMLFFLFNKNKKYYLFVILSGLFIFFGILSLSNYLDLSTLRLFNTQETGIDIRMDIYQNYIEAISINIIFPLMDPYYNLLYAHNIFFAIYSGTGIFGLIIFLYLVCFALRASFKLIYNNTPYGWVSLIFILTLTISSVSGAILDEIFWMNLVLINIYYIKQRKNI
jgi:O-antigen ligase